jgi:hypothetical protein
MRPRTSASNPAAAGRLGLAVTLVSESFLGMVKSGYAKHSGVNWSFQSRTLSGLLRVLLMTSSFWQSRVFTSKFN